MKIIETLNRHGNPAIRLKYKHKTNGRRKYLKTPEWKAIRDKILDRDNHRCVEYKSIESLTVHHKNKDGWDHHENNLVTLCWRCYIKRHH